MVISAVQWEKPEPGLSYPSFLSIGTMILCGPLFSSMFSRLISNSSQREVGRKKLLLSHKFLFRIIFWAWREKDAPVRGVTSVPCVWTSGELSLGPVEALCLCMSGMQRVNLGFFPFSLWCISKLHHQQQHVKELTVRKSDPPVWLFAFLTTADSVLWTPLSSLHVREMLSKSWNEHVVKRVFTLRSRMSPCKRKYRDHVAETEISSWAV